MGSLRFLVLLLTLVCGSASAAQAVEFRGDDSVFGVVAVATAMVAIEPPFLRVTIDRGMICATSVAKSPERIAGFRIHLTHSLPSGAWEPVRKSELVKMDVTLDHLESVAIGSRTLMIPIDGIDNLRDKWLVFEVDVDGAPQGFTYAHSQKLTQP